MPYLSSPLPNPVDHETDEDGAGLEDLDPTGDAEAVVQPGPVLATHF